MKEKMKEIDEEYYIGFLSVAGVILKNKFFLAVIFSSCCKKMDSIFFLSAVKVMELKMAP